MSNATAARQCFTTVEKHYRRIANDYDRLLYYSPEFVGAVSKKIIDALALTSDDQFVDLGCGTGMYTIEIANQVQFSTRPYAVDPFIEMLRQVPQGNGFRTIMMDALIFSRQTMQYDKVLIKESVHHVADRPALFANLYRRLPAGGRLLLVGVPPKIEYQLFQAALDRSRSWHADPAALAAELQNAGFTVGTDVFTFNHAIPKNTYVDMVRTRYMSLLSTFTDEEIELGIREIEHRYRDTETLQFTDRFQLVLGVKQN